MSSSTLNVLIGVFAVLALFFIVRAVRVFRRKRIVGGAFNVASALAMILAAVCVALIGIGLHGFERLTYERTAAEVRFTKTGDKAYSATVRYPDGSVGDFGLRGDDWQIDARMLTFKPLASLLGFDSMYRLERLGGRYRDIEEERSAARTVHALTSASSIDLWEIARRYHEKAPWVDAYYGNATYVPMADGAQFAVNVSQTGIKARPMNEPARNALANWQ